MAGQGYAYTSHEADGVQTVYTFAFVGEAPGYFNEDHIHAYQRTKAVDPEQGDADEWEEIEPTAWVMNSTNAIQFFVAPFTNDDGKDDVMIRREMPKNAPYGGYTIGTRFTQKTLNHSFLQQLYSLHEAYDNMGGLPGGNAGLNIFEDIDMQGFRIRNLGEPQDFFDAVNKGVTDALAARVGGIEAAQGTLARGPQIISYSPPSGIPDELSEWVQIGDVT